MKFTIIAITAAFVLTSTSAFAATAVKKPHTMTAAEMAKIVAGGIPGNDATGHAYGWDKNNPDEPSGNACGVKGNCPY